MKAKHILAMGFVGLLCLVQGARPAHADTYTLDLTGVGDGAVADGVYVSPYQGTITSNSSGTQIFSGYMICDDFNTESYLNHPWTATATNAAALNGSEKFQTSLTGYTVQQNYNAVAWLANQLLLPSNVTDGTTQTDYSFAIWDIMDGQSTNPDGGTPTLIGDAFDAVKGGYTGNNVTVYTAQPLGASQEFLVVQTPEPGALALLFAGLLVIGCVAFLRRKQFDAASERA